VAWNKDIITLDEFTQRLLQYKREAARGAHPHQRRRARLLRPGDLRVRRGPQAGFTRVYIETHVK